MNTNINRAPLVGRWKEYAIPAATFALGVILGAGGGQFNPPMACHAPRLTAHFLERYVAMRLEENAPVQTEVLHGAPEEAEEKAVSEPEPVIQAPVEPVVETVPEAPASVVPVSSVAAVESSSLESPVEEVVSSESLSSVSSISSSSSISSISSSSESSSSVESSSFPEFERALYPVGRIPNWGAMKSAAEWDQTYGQMDKESFVRLPSYNLADLTHPVEDLKKTRDEPETIKLLTAKLFYSTRFFGGYDLDSGEFEAVHPGMDLKLPEGMPVGAVAGGRVSSVIRLESGLGLHVIIEHRIDDQTYYSIYGHLSSAWVSEGDDVRPGQGIGAAGSTGRSSHSHLHLQIDRGEPGEAQHSVYWPASVPSASEAAKHTVHPITFIRTHAQ